MTVIEMFDKTPIENIITSLAFKPDRVVFVGSNYRKANRSIPIYREIFEGRGVNIDMSVKCVAKNNLEDIVRSLESLISDPDEVYIIDISGGDESSLVAIGMILESDSMAGKEVYLFRINVVSRHGVLFKLKETDGKRRLERNIYDFSYNSQVYLTADENIRLNGGTVFSSGITFERGDAVGKDIDSMWEICRWDPSGWNMKIGRFSGVISRLSDGDDLFTIHRDSIADDGNSADPKLWEEFVKRGLVLIEENQSGRGVYVFRFKNQITQECLTKSGSILEYVTYKAAIEVKRDELPLFDSAEIGIVIGWNDDPKGTRNEIDCMLMCGCVPIFISCKNGDIKTDELYKLDSVADKFGSGYGKTALLSTVYFDENARSYDGDRATQNIKDRANNMGIRIISKVHLSTAKKLRNDIEKLTY